MIISGMIIPEMIIPDILGTGIAWVGLEETAMASPSSRSVRTRPDTVTRRKNPPPLARPSDRTPDEHEGATDDRVGDRTGPGAGYDKEPEKVRDKGGVKP
jgi:hypothetical protein